MKINNLKIGDKIKFFWSVNKTIYEGKITIIEKDHVQVTSSAPVWIKKEDIISKLELVPDSYPGSHYWAETPIEKEESLKPEFKSPEKVYKCKICHVLNLSLNEPGLTCKECKEEYTYKCTDELVKEKSAPKSFKFEIDNLKEFSYGSERVRHGYFSEAYLKIVSNNIKVTNDSLEIKGNKSYTVEIKEKE